MLSLRKVNALKQSPCQNGQASLQHSLIYWLPANRLDYTTFSAFKASDSSPTFHINISMYLSGLGQTADIRQSTCCAVASRKILLSLVPDQIQVSQFLSNAEIAPLTSCARVGSWGRWTCWSHLVDWRYPAEVSCLKVLILLTVSPYVKAACQNF